MMGLHDYLFSDKNLIIHQDNEKHMIFGIFFFRGVNWFQNLIPRG